MQILKIIQLDNVNTSLDYEIVPPMTSLVGTLGYLVRVPERGQERLTETLDPTQ